MTLHEFVKKNGITLVGGDSLVVYSTDKQLWSLSDHKVSSACGTHVRLVPTTDKPDACPDCGFIGCQSGCVLY